MSNLMSHTMLANAFMLPKGASTFAEAHDFLFNFILFLCTIFFIAICAAIVGFAYKYRRLSEDQKTSPIRGDHKLEIVWSAIPTILLLGLFVLGFKGFMDGVVPPGDALNVRITGQKWSWTMTHPNGGSDGNILVVPVNEPVKLTMSSTDVLHSFYVPAFRIKRDVIPNRYTVLWFEATELGDFHIFCTEYCGDNHSKMIGTVKVVTREQYDEYVKGLTGCGEGSLAECGQREYTRRGCAGCHSVDGSRLVGPSWKGLYENNREFADGSSVVGDDNYIRESIVNPKAKIVAGYADQMPTYAGQLSDEQINALIEYIKTLK